MEQGYRGQNTDTHREGSMYPDPCTLYPQSMSRFTITTPIFYVNARPHIGHAYAVVAADVLARFHRLRGDDVSFLTGTDEHGTKIAEAAAAAGKKPQAFADEIAATFRETWRALNVDFTDFIRTTEPRHASGVCAVVEALRTNGDLEQRTYRGLYCVGCEKFVTEKELDERGREPIHQRVPEVVEERNWFFKLSKYLPEVERALRSGELRVLPEERANEALGALRALGDFSISRDRTRVPWGIPLPFDDTQVAYVWFDALQNYITAFGYGSEGTSKLEKYWPADVQVIGQDILKFHAVYWPAILLALKLPLPRTLAVHGFFTVNGQKVSKSLGNTIDPLAFAGRYGADATRYLLLSQFTFGTSGDVQAARFDEQYTGTLANTIGNLVSRAWALLQKFSDSRIPSAVPDREAAERIGAFGMQGAALERDAGRLVDALVRTPVELAAFLNQWLDHASPWKETDDRRRAATLRTLTDGVATLSLVVEPLLPTTAGAIQRAFGVVLGSPPRAGTRVHPTDPPILFPRVVL